MMGLTEDKRSANAFRTQGHIIEATVYGFFTTDGQFLQKTWKAFPPDVELMDNIREL